VAGKTFSIEVAKTNRHIVNELLGSLSAVLSVSGHRLAKSDTKLGHLHFAKLPRTAAPCNL